MRVLNDSKPIPLVDERGGAAGSANDRLHLFVRGGEPGEEVLHLQDVDVRADRLRRDSLRAAAGRAAFGTGVGRRCSSRLRFDSGCRPQATKALTAR